MDEAERRLLRDLANREAVRDIVLRYAEAVDRRDLQAVADCFTSDAEYEGALARGTVADALAALRDSLRRYDATFHFIGNQRVEVRGDSATCESYAVAFHHVGLGADRRELTVAVRYADELVRRGGEWRIRRRVAHTVWTRGDLPPPRDPP